MPENGQLYSFRSSDGSLIEVKCPICAHDKFIDSGPSDLTKRRGFFHVVVGVAGDGKMLSMPVRFKACSRCGFIVQNLIFRDEEQ